MLKINTVIIGGGISGLSAGHFLKKKKIDFVIIESNKKLGGVIQTIKKNNFTFENGPNTILNNNTSINQLLKDLRILNKIILPNKKANTNRYVFNNNNPIAIPTSLLKFVLTPLLTFQAKFRVFKEIFKPVHKKNTSVINFISSRFGKEFHDKLIEPFLNGIYAGDTSKMSSKHALKKFWKLEQKFGSIIKGLFCSKKEKIESFNFSRGISFLIRTITNSLKKEIINNTKVTNILKEGENYKIETNSNKTFLCQNIICSIPAYELRNIIFDNDLSTVLSKIKYNAVDVFHFVFLKNDIKNDLNGFGILTKPSDNKIFLGVIFSSKIFPHICSEKYEIYTVIVGGEKQKYILKTNKSKLKKLVLKELRDLINCNGELQESNNYSWKNGIPQYNLYQEKVEESIQKFSEKNKKFHIIGNYFSGISVSDCIKKAEVIVENHFSNNQ